MTAIEFNTKLISHAGLLKNFALVLTKNAEDAQDLVQETYLKAFMYKEKFTDSTNFKAWLCTIMKNIFINNYRRSVRFKRIIEENLDFMCIEKNESRNTVESVINYKDLDTSISKLKGTTKTSFVKHNEGYKYKEIAEELAIPLGSVKSHIFQARKLIIKYLKEN